MHSNYIRQRLLEGGTLGLPETVQLSISLEVASQNMEAYTSNRAAPSWASWAQPSTDPGAMQACAAQRPANAGGPKCYFCCQGTRPRQRCPARNATSGNARQTASASSEATVGKLRRRA